MNQPGRWHGCAFGKDVVRDAETAVEAMLFRTGGVILAAAGRCTALRLVLAPLAHVRTKIGHPKQVAGTSWWLLGFLPAASLWAPGRTTGTHYRR